MKDDNAEEFKPEQVKQLKLAAGPSIIGYVRCYMPETNSFVIDYPMAIEKYIDDSGVLRVLLFPYMEMARVDSTIMIPYQHIVTAHTVTEASVEYYLDKCRQHMLSPSARPQSLEDWEPEEDAVAN